MVAEKRVKSFFFNFKSTSSSLQMFKVICSAPIDVVIDSSPSKKADPIKCTLLQLRNSATSGTSITSVTSVNTYLIFVTGTTGGACGEKNLSCGEISPHRQIFMWTNSPHNRLSCRQILDMTDCYVEKILHMRNVKTICNVEE